LSKGIILAVQDEMNISLQPAVEARLREKAQAEGVTVEAYLEGLLRAQEQAEDELETLALDGLDSGESIPIDSAYWEDKHRRLDERLKKTGTRRMPSASFARKPTGISNSKLTTTLHVRRLSLDIVSHRGP